MALIFQYLLHSKVCERNTHTNSMHIFSTHLHSSVLPNGRVHLFCIVTMLKNFICWCGRHLHTRHCITIYSLFRSFSSSLQPSVYLCVFGGGGCGKLQPSSQPFWMCNATQDVFDLYVCLHHVLGLCPFFVCCHSPSASLSVLRKAQYHGHTWGNNTQNEMIAAPVTILSVTL